MEKAMAVAKGVLKTKAFWSMAALVAVAVGTPMGSTVVKLVESVACVSLGGCV